MAATRSYFDQNALRRRRFSLWLISINSSIRFYVGTIGDMGGTLRHKGFGVPSLWGHVGGAGDIHRGAGRMSPASPAQWGRGQPHRYWLSPASPLVPVFFHNVHLLAVPHSTGEYVAACCADTRNARLLRCSPIAAWCNPPSLNERRRNGLGIESRAYLTLEGFRQYHEFPHAGHCRRPRLGAP